MFDRWFSNVRVFLVWLLGFVMTLVILALLHELVVVFVVNTLGMDRYDTRFISMLYYFPAGVICLAYVFFVYQYLNQSTRGLNLTMKSLKLFGIQLLSIALIQLCLVMYRYIPGSTVNVILIVAEGLVGAVFLYRGLYLPERSTGH